MQLALTLVVLAKNFSISFWVCAQLSCSHTPLAAERVLYTSDPTIMFTITLLYFFSPRTNWLERSLIWWREWLCQYKCCKRATFVCRAELKDVINYSPTQISKMLMVFIWWFKNDRPQSGCQRQILCKILRAVFFSEKPHQVSLSVFLYAGGEKSLSPHPADVSWVNTHKRVGCAKNTKKERVLFEKGTRQIKLYYIAFLWRQLAWCAAQ